MSLELPSRKSPSSSAHIVSEILKNAQHSSIGDYSNLGTVRGDQHNYYNTSTELKKRRFIVGTEEEEAEYVEFPEIKRGELVAMREICCSKDYVYDREQRKWVERGKRTVVAGDVRLGNVASNCTVIQYSGEGAGELWKEDFQRLCGIRRPENAQLVAINLSSIPMLVLTGDLVPLAHLADRVGGLGQAYLKSLAIQMDCYYDETLWMDTLRGVFCRGPKGPYWVGEGVFSFRDLPSDAELVKEDTLLRFLISRNQDRVVVDALSWESDGGTSQLEANQPTVISTLTDTILAVGSGVWKECWRICLGEREELANGATRFTLLHDGRRLELWLDWEESQSDWLAQAPSIFHAHRIPLEGDMEKYKLVLPQYLEGTLSNSEAQQQRRKESPPIYLFIPPLSTSIFWSFDPDGQNPITADLCHHLGLPISLKLHCWELCWGTEIYKALQTYQIARGFDPNTNEFAQHNGYRIYEIVEQPFSSRFEEIESSEPMDTSLHPEDISPGAPFGNVQPEDSATNATTQGHVLQKGARHSPDCPDQNQSSTPHSDFTDFVWVNTAEIDCPLPRDLISVSPARDSEIVPAEAGTKDAIPPKLNAWSRFLPAFS